MAQLDDIQGNLLRAYSLPYGQYIFLRIIDATRARDWLASIIDSVTSVTAWDKKPEWTFNVAFTFSGLKALGLPDETLDSFPTAFREGMAHRAADLSDTGPSHPDKWAFGKDSTTFHALVEIHANNAAERTQRYQWHQAMLQGAAEVVYQKETAMLNGGTEHFGFHDGFSQPDIQGSGAPSYPGQGKPNAAGGWSPLATGEFVLGYYDETGHREAMPNPDVLGYNGSYMVVRMLRQNVVAFREFLKRNAASVGSEELLAAKMVGRWRSGAPLALAQAQDDPALGADLNRNNDFRYGKDLEGLICPYTAHVRRVNPRDALDNNPQVVVSRHRILRRGMPYGCFLPKDAPDDGAERGIMFAAVNASITRQFEFVQKNWINNGDFIDRGNEKDPVLGNHGPDAVFTIPKKPIRKRVAGLSSFVETAGGGYFFLPGINALRWLCDQKMTSTKVVAQEPTRAAHSASSASACPYLSKFDSLAESKTGADLEIARGALLKEGVFHDPVKFFKELREHRPIVVTAAPTLTTVVAASTDVMEVLSNNTKFPVLPYQNPINTTPPPTGYGHFLLGDLNTERHDREKEAFQSAMKSGNECRAEIRAHAEGLVALVTARKDGKIDVIEDVAELLPIKVFDTYFGVPTGGSGGMPERDMCHHICRIFRGLFMNLERDPAVQKDAVASVEILQKYVDWLVQSRKAQVIASPSPPEDVLGKFIWYQGHPESQYRDVFSSQERVVANLCGILTGGVAGFIQAIGFIIDVLTTQHADQWPGAVSAATSDRVDNLWGYAQEALRFRPQGPGIVRGTDPKNGAALGRITIPHNSVVLASHQSAMMDEKLVPDPSRFDPTRPDSCYLHFGYGRNRCLAVDLAPVIIAEGLRAILRLKNVRRPPESSPKKGKPCPKSLLKMDEPYPESLILSYDI